MSNDTRGPDLRRCADTALVDLISRGSVPAFVVLFDRTAAAVLAELAARLPDVGRAGEVFAATYVEVWWLAGCHHGPDTDTLGWIIDIVRRRAAEPQSTDESAGVQLRPSYAELEVAALLKRSVDRLWPV